MKKPKKVLDGVWNALKAGGSFVGEMGACGNVESVVQIASNILMEKMILNPILIERPIVVFNDKAVVGRPPEKVLEIL